MKHLTADHTCFHDVRFSQKAVLSMTILHTGSRLTDAWMAYKMNKFSIAAFRIPTRHREHVRNRWHKCMRRRKPSCKRATNKCSSVLGTQTNDHFGYPSLHVLHCCIAELKNDPSPCPFGCSDNDNSGKSGK